MSSRRAGGGRGGEVGVEAIPESVRRTIQSIRETTGKQHSDEEILTVFEACSMDADETAQRLLYLDTFHEVKRKPRKETFSTQDRGSKGFRGNNFDGFGGRNPGPRRANGSNHRMNNSNALIAGTRSPNIAINGPSSLPEANPSLEFNMPLPANGDMKDGSAADGKKTTPPKLLPVATSSSTNIRSYSAVIQAKQVKLTSNSNAHPVSKFGLGSPASDPVLRLLPQSLRTHHAAESASKSDVMGQGKPASVGANTGMAEDYRSKPTEQDQSIRRTTKPGKEDKAEEIPLADGKNDSSLSSSLPNQNGFLSAKTPSLDAPTMEEMVIPLNDGNSPASLSPVTTMKNGHVIFPNRFKVPREVKSCLIFGNFEAKSKQETNFGDVHGTNTEPKSAIDSAATSDEIAEEVSDEKVAAVQVDQPASCDDGHELESLSQGESNIVPVVDPKHDQPKQETGLVLEGHQASLVQVTPSYNYNIMPQLGHFLHLEGHGTQAQDTSLVSAVVSESPASASASSTPPAQTNLATSPRPVLFRPPYHPSYFPYGPYFHPYFFPPMHHPFLSHNGLPQPQATANPYLASAPNAAGIKFSIPHMKSGAGAGNPTPTGLPPMFYGSAPVGYNSGQTVTSGSLSNGDSSASQSKENHIYATGPPSEVPSWITPTGQEISGMHLNSLYHLQAQGQHLAFPPAQAGHGPFAGLYHPDQTIAAPSTGNQLPQQSQAVPSTATESGGPPSGAYQQPQLAPHNWNSSY